MVFVAFGITPELRRPIVLPRPGLMCDLAAVSVPEASMDENDLLASGKDQIWPAGELVIMQPVTIPKGVHEAADDKLRS